MATLPSDPRSDVRWLDPLCRRTIHFWPTTEFFYTPIVLISQTSRPAFFLVSWWPPPCLSERELFITFLLIWAHFSYFYSSSNQCLQVTISPPYYPNSPYDGHYQLPQRPETSQRKRPKYTRSKTGCLTCRIKKIKVCVLPIHAPAMPLLACFLKIQCDETKPSCMRCTHGSREVHIGIAFRIPWLNFHIF